MHSCPQAWGHGDLTSGKGQSLSRGRRYTLFFAGHSGLSSHLLACREGSPPRAAGWRPSASLAPLWRHQTILATGRPVALEAPSKNWRPQGSRFESARPQCAIEENENVLRSIAFGIPIAVGLRSPARYLKPHLSCEQRFPFLRKGWNPWRAESWHRQFAWDLGRQ